MSDARCAFNLAAADVVGHASAAVDPLVRFARPLVGAVWRARLMPVDPGWLTLAASVPLMSTERAHAELDWAPAVSAQAVLRELFQGLHDDAALATPALAEQRTRDTATTEPTITLSTVRPFREHPLQ